MGRIFKVTICDLNRKSGLPFDIAKCDFKQIYEAVAICDWFTEGMSGARYEDLKRLKCEVQVRTVLQDAWAIIDHHLVYKKESAVPTSLQRKLNSLAGLFETADDQFEQIRQQRKEYMVEMRQSSVSDDSFLGHEVNADSLLEYLNWKFPGIPLESWSGQFKLTQDGLDFRKYPTLKELDRLVDKTRDARQTLYAQLKVTKVKGKVPSAVELGITLCLVDNEYSKKLPLTPDWRQMVEKHRYRNE